MLTYFIISFFSFVIGGVFSVSLVNYLTDLFHKYDDFNFKLETWDAYQQRMSKCKSYKKD